MIHNHKNFTYEYSNQCVNIEKKPLTQDQNA